MDTIHIALPSDQNYVIGLIATAGSMAYHASHDVILSIHVLDGGIHDDTFAEFRKKIERLHPHVQLSRIKVNEELFVRFPAWAGNRMTYARLMLADALPDVNHIIYSDTDFLWLADIAELWALRADDVIFESVVDYHSTIEKEKVWAESKGLPFNDQTYFGAGLSFYNLEMFREEHLVEQVADFLQKYPDVLFADQTALNHLLLGRVKLLPEQWQTLSLQLTPEKVNKPCAIHYGGDIPWARSKFWTWLLSDASMLWYSMMDEIDQVPPDTTLKKYLNCWQRFYKRTLANILKNDLGKSVVSSLLRVTGRNSHLININRYTQNLKLSKQKARHRILTKNMGEIK